MKLTVDDVKIGDVIEKTYIDDTVVVGIVVEKDYEDDFPIKLKVLYSEEGMAKTDVGNVGYGISTDWCCKKVRILSDEEAKGYKFLGERK